MAGRRSPARGTILVRAALVAVAVAVGLAGSPALPRAKAAPLPGDWCAPAPSATDRPDAVSGPQIHVVYAYPADGPDRTSTLATRIARDLAGVDTWWRSQDPTRTPRFDFADFPGCDSQFGALDITTLALPGPTASYGSANASLADAVRTEITRAEGTRGTKAHLVYLDAPVTVDDGQTVCGIAFANLAFVFLQQPPGCSPGGGLGSGNGWPARTAAHELTHLFTNGNLLGAPHVCPDDAGHICEPGSNDLLDTASPSQSQSSSLSGVVLDPGRDDYYGHGQISPGDGRTSELLARLDEPQRAVTVAIAPRGGGQIASTASGIECPPTCSTPFDGHTTVRLLATPTPGFVFREWRGDCTGSGTQCTVLTDAPRSVTARFDVLVPYTVRVKGPGQVSADGEPCSDRCKWDAVARTKVELTAEPTQGSRFAGWSDACDGNRRQCRVSVGKRTTVTATFTRG